MKKQLIELAEEEIQKAKPIGLPVTVEFDTVDDTDKRLKAYMQIVKKSPSLANAFTRGRAKYSGLFNWYSVAVQYYQLGGRK